MGNKCGAAYIFYKFYGKWQEQAKIVPYDCQNDGNAFYFGSSVSVYDTTVAVGAYAGHGHWDNAGCVYIYTLQPSGWLLQKKLIAHDGMSGDKFGWDVSLYKDTVIVGAWGEQGKEEPEDDRRENDRNNPRVRRLQGGDREREEREHQNGENCGPNSPPDCRQYRGYYNYRGESAGAAYVFARSGTSWVQEFKLLPSTSEANDAFGSAVDIHENVLFIGAYQADGAYDNTGAAYLYAPPSMSPSYVAETKTKVYMVTGEAKLDALLAVCLILVPACVAGVWYYTNYNKGDKSSRDMHMPVSTDSQHGSVAPWSMHGAFDDSSRGSSSRGVPTRSPLRGPPVAR